jgi:hypothetical protein
VPPPDQEYDPWRVDYRPRLPSMTAAGEWFLGNAGPELDVALRQCSALWPRPNDSTAPIRGIFLTDAELDHTLGLLSLRQASELHVYGTAAVRILLSQCGVLPT